jgi:hypothetical protein
MALGPKLVPDPLRPSLVGKLGLDCVEGGTIDDGGMLARMGLAPVDHFADVESVLEKMRQGAESRPWTWQGDTLHGLLRPQLLRFDQGGHRETRSDTKGAR